MADNINPAIQAMMNARIPDTSDAFSGLRSGLQNLGESNRRKKQQEMIDQLVAGAGVAYGAMDFEDDEQQVNYLIEQSKRLSEDGYEDLANETLNMINMDYDQRKGVLNGDLLKASQYLKIPGISGGVNKSAANKYWQPIKTRKPALMADGTPVMDAQGNPVYKNVLVTPGIQDDKPVMLEQELEGDFLTNVGETIEEQRIGETNLAGSKKTAQLSAEAAGKPSVIDATRDAEVQTAQEIAKAEAEQKNLSGFRIDIKKDIMGGASAAKRGMGELVSIKRALDILGNKNLGTGRIAKAQNILGSFIPGLKDVDAEVFEGLVFDQVTQKLRNTPGIATDADFNNQMKSMPDLGKSLEANVRLLDAAMEAVDRRVHEDMEFRKFLAGGGQPEDFSVTYKPVPPEHIEFFKKNRSKPNIRANFKEKYGYIPTGY